MVLAGRSSAPTDARRLRYWLRRVVVIAVVIASIVMVVRAYSDPYKVFGFQMFPEASTWQADIYRVTASGERLPIDAPWPGGYRWDQLVDERGLGAPQVRQSAAYGVDSTLAFLQHALDYVANSTPADPVTRWLEAEVTFSRNGGAEQTVLLVSKPRGDAP